MSSAITIERNDDEQEQEGHPEDEGEHYREVLLHCLVEIDRFGGCAGHVGVGAGDVPEAGGDDLVSERVERRGGLVIGSVTGERHGDHCDGAVRV